MPTAPRHDDRYGAEPAWSAARVQERAGHDEDAPPTFQRAADLWPISAYGRAVGGIWA
jgi:hypothetical protein